MVTRLSSLRMNGHFMVSELDFKTGSINALFVDSTHLPFDAITTDEAAYFELYNGVVKVNKDAVDQGALILNSNTQEKIILKIQMLDGFSIRLVYALHCRNLGKCANCTTGRLFFLFCWFFE